jgi:hypothetical protein
MVGEKHREVPVFGYSLISFFFSEKCGGGEEERKAADFLRRIYKEGGGYFPHFLRGENNVAATQ